MKTDTLIYQAIITLLIATLWVLNITSEPITYFLTTLCISSIAFLSVKEQIIFFNKNSIKDNWNNNKAKEIVLRILSEVKNEKTILKNSTFHSKSPLVHDVIDFYNFNTTANNDFSKIAVAYSKPEKEMGHSASVTLSFIEFSNFKKGWKLTHKYIATIQAGSFAEPPSNIGVFTIGHSILGIIIETGFTNQGITEVIKLVYANFDGEFKNIFEYVSLYDDSGITGIPRNAYETTLHQIKEGTGLYDLQLITAGIRDSIKIKETAIYKYNGIKYEKVKSYL